MTQLVLTTEGWVRREIALPDRPLNALSDEKLERLTELLAAEGVAVPLLFMRNWCGLKVGKFEHTTNYQARVAIKRAQAREWQAMNKWHVEERRKLDMENMDINS